MHFSENNEAKPEDPFTRNPPRVATGLLSFFLPASLREPILGDLEEEFTHLLLSSGSAARGLRWYWWQVVKNAGHFFWEQRGTAMAYLISVAFFIFMLGLVVLTSGFGQWYLMPPVIILTVPTSLLLGIGATSIKAAKNAISLSFSESTEHSSQAIRMAVRFLHVTGNQFLLVSSVGVVVGIVQVLMMASSDPSIISEASIYNRYAMVILPLFYGIIFKSVLYSAEQKLVGRYLDA